MGKDIITIAVKKGDMSFVFIIKVIDRSRGGFEKKTISFDIGRNARKMLHWHYKQTKNPKGWTYEGPTCIYNGMLCSIIIKHSSYSILVFLIQYIFKV